MRICIHIILYILTLHIHNLVRTSGTERKRNPETCVNAEK